MLRKLYVWPEDRPQIRKRVMIAFGLLIAAKGLNVVVPYIFKKIVDILSEYDNNRTIGSKETVLCVCCEFDKSN